MMSVTAGASIAFGTMLPMSGTGPEMSTPDSPLERPAQWNSACLAAPSVQDRDNRWQEGVTMYIIDARQLRANEVIERIAGLKENWNYNGAPAFSELMIQAAREILKKLPKAPTIVPTARPSIWMEYHDSEKGRLVFELFEDNSIMQYRRSAAWVTEKREIQPQDTPGIVLSFYGQL